MIVDIDRQPQVAVEMKVTNKYSFLMVGRSDCSLNYIQWRFARRGGNGHHLSSSPAMATSGTSGITPAKWPLSLLNSLAVLGFCCWLSWQKFWNFYAAGHVDHNFDELSDRWVENGKLFGKGMIIVPVLMPMPMIDRSRIRWSTNIYFKLCLQYQYSNMLLFL